MIKRTIHMVDKSLMGVDLTFWGDLAEKTNESVLGQVLAVKACRVSEFEGPGSRVLNSTFGSRVFVGLDRPEVKELRDWFEKQGKELRTESVSKKGGNFGGDRRLTFQQVKDENLGMNEKPDYFVVKGTITFFRHDLEKPPWYNSCPMPECNKKVIQIDANNWRCEACNKNFPEAPPRFILSFMCCDASGSHWLTAFNEVAQELLKHSAQEVYEFRQHSNDKMFERVFQEANFKSYLFKCRAKQDNMNDAVRVRLQVMQATPINFKNECHWLLGEINAYGNV